MTSDISENYILGRDVTHLALGESRDTVVLSVRMPRANLDHLEKLCAVSGKSFSQVILDAIAAYQAEPAGR